MARLLYYAQKMFSTYIGDQVVSVDAKNIPTQLRKLSRRDSLNNVNAENIATLYYVATKNSKTGTVYLKMVNTGNSAQKISINVNGVAKVASNGLSVILKADDPKQTNSITDPEKVVPVTKKIKGMKKKFNYVFPAYSISVLQLETSGNK